MLSNLRIQNVAIAENIELELHPGLNILTGETGAGKSIILKSIELLTGKKTQGSIVRSGSDKAIIEGLFHLSSKEIEKISREIEEFSELVSDSEVLIKRVIDGTGRSKYYLNGSLVTTGTISHICRYLIDITGQHDQQNLKDTSYQRNILDAFGTPPALLEKVAATFSAYTEKNTLLKNLEKSKEQILFRIEKLQFEKKELQELALRKGEKEELEQELDKVKHLDKIKLGLQEVLSLLDNKYHAQKMDPAKRTNISSYDALSRTCTILSQLSQYDSEIENSYNTALQAMHCFNELLSQIEHIHSNLQFDSFDYDKKQTRLTHIKQIERKYRKESQELIAYLEEIKTELSNLESNTFDEKKLHTECIRLRNELTELEQTLTQTRKDSAIKMGKLVLDNLKEVNLQKARFEIHVLQKESTSHGANEIIFNFSANPGETLQPLEKVASGGELSRIQLVLKSLNVKNAKEDSPQRSFQTSLQVFDEIDTGVSGAVSQSIGEKLLTISKQNQVIAITHSAQIAALADTHIYVQKEVHNERTFSRVSYLDKNQRIDVIAAMLAGKNVTSDFKKSAEKLLEIRSKKE